MSETAVTKVEPPKDSHGSAAICSHFVDRVKSPWRIQEVVKASRLADYHAGNQAGLPKRDQTCLRAFHPREKETSESSGN